MIPSKVKRAKLWCMYTSVIMRFIPYIFCRLRIIQRRFKIWKWRRRWRSQWQSILVGRNISYKYFNFLKKNALPPQVVRYYDSVLSPKRLAVLLVMVIAIVLIIWGMLWSKQGVKFVLCLRGGAFVQRCVAANKSVDRTNCSTVLHYNCTPQMESYQWLSQVNTMTGLIMVTTHSILYLLEFNDFHGKLINKSHPTYVYKSIVVKDLKLYVQFQKRKVGKSVYALKNTRHPNIQL